jgi:hypothetical protein
MAAFTSPGRRQHVDLGTAATVPDGGVDLDLDLDLDPDPDPHPHPDQCQKGGGVEAKHANATQGTQGTLGYALIRQRPQGAHVPAGPPDAAALRAAAGGSLPARPGRGCGLMAALRAFSAWVAAALGRRPSTPPPQGHKMPGRAGHLIVFKRRTFKLPTLVKVGWMWYREASDSPCIVLADDRRYDDDEERDRISIQHQQSRWRLQAQALVGNVFPLGYWCASYELASLHAFLSSDNVAAPDALLPRFTEWQLQRIAARLQLAGYPAVQMEKVLRRYADSDRLGDLALAECRNTNQDGAPEDPATLDVLERDKTTVFFRDVDGGLTCLDWETAYQEVFPALLQGKVVRSLRTHAKMSVAMIQQVLSQLRDKVDCSTNNLLPSHDADLDWNRVVQEVNAHGVELAVLPVELPIHDGSGGHFRLKYWCPTPEVERHLVHLTFRCFMQHRLDRVRFDRDAADSRSWARDRQSLTRTLVRMEGALWDACAPDSYMLCGTLPDAFVHPGNNPLRPYSPSRSPLSPRSCRSTPPGSPRSSLRIGDRVPESLHLGSKHRRGSQRTSSRASSSSSRASSSSSSRAGRSGPPPVCALDAAFSFADDEDPNTDIGKRVLGRRVTAWMRDAAPDFAEGTYTALVDSPVQGLEPPPPPSWPPRPTSRRVCSRTRCPARTRRPRLNICPYSQPKCLRRRGDWG